MERATRRILITEIDRQTIARIHTLLYRPLHLMRGIQQKLSLPKLLLAHHTTSGQLQSAQGVRNDSSPPSFFLGE